MRSYFWTFRTTVMLRDQDVDVEVEYVPGTCVPASCRGHPDNWTPDESEPAEIESVRAIRKDGSRGKNVGHLLGQNTLDALAGEAWERGNQERADRQEDAAASRRDD